MVKRKNRNPAVFAAIGAVAVTALLLAWFYSFDHATPAANVPVSFTVGNRTFGFTSYALNISQQEQGLMNATVTNQTFELFVFRNQSFFQFWMKDTYSPLDIMWVDANGTTGRIVYIVNATPCASYDPSQTNCDIYTPPSVANYVIETKAGFAERYGILDYEKITFNFGG